MQQARIKKKKGKDNQNHHFLFLPNGKHPNQVCEITNVLFLNTQISQHFT